MTAGALGGLCAAVGLFALVNVLTGWLRTGLNGNEWWLDVRALGLAGDLLLAAAGAALLLHTVRPRWRRIRWAACAGAALLAAIALANTLTFYVLAARGDIDAGIPIPFSLLTAGLLAMVALGLGRCGWVSRRTWLKGTAAAASVAALIALLPITQMVFFGNTDYARPADAIVVFGARVYADERPSDALSDRVLHACALYERGLAPIIVMSGGPGDGETHECEAMRDLALSHGVPGEAIVLDREGVNTRATIDNLARAFKSHPLRRAIAVSHFYHLPRIRMTASRAGFDVVTSPAAQRDGRLVRLPWFMAREAAAFWVYWARDLVP